MTFKSFLAVAALAVALPTSGFAQTPAFDWTVIPDSIKSTVGGIQMHGSAMVEVDGKKFLYIIAGNRQNTPDGAPGITAGDMALIYYAELTSLDPPSVSAWQKTTWEFSNSTSYFTRACFGHNGRLYIVGGSRNDAVNGLGYNGIRVFEPTATGDLIAENTALGIDGDATGLTPSLLAVETASALDTSSNRLYVVPGGSTSVHRFDLDPVTGAVGTPTTLSSSLVFAYSNGMNPVVRDGYLYLISTSTAANRGKVQFAEILPNGDLGAFQETTSLPDTRYDGGAAVVNNRLFALVGSTLDNTTPREDVLEATFGANGTITGWTVDSVVPGTLPPDVEGAVPGLRRVGAVSLGNDGIAILGGRSYGANFLGNIYFGITDRSNVSDWELY